MFIPIVLAQNESANVVLTFVDAISKEPISDVFVNVETNGNVSTYYLEKDQNLRLNLKKEDYRLKILVNDPTTKSYDYYGETFLSTDKESVNVIYLYPVGSLSGFVKDKLDIVIAAADLKFNCNNAFGLNYPQKTDKFGSFSLDYVPIGNCTVYGSYQESLGVGEVEVKKGEKNAVDVKLNNVLIVPNDRNYSDLIFLSLIVVILVAGGLGYYFMRKTKSLEKKEREEEKVINKLKEEVTEVQESRGLSQKEKDIIKTLRDNERKIVEFLLEQKDPVYFSKIHYKTGLSKSSLFRNLRSLENKHIVETVKEGKVRMVKLSDWFLAK